jgi:hypothetical protein
MVVAWLSMCCLRIYLQGLRKATANLSHDSWHNWDSSQRPLKYKPCPTGGAARNLFSGRVAIGIRLALLKLTLHNFNVAFTVCHFSVYTYQQLLTTLFNTLFNVSLFAFRCLLCIIFRSFTHINHIHFISSKVEEDPITPTVGIISVLKKNLVYNF